MSVGDLKEGRFYVNLSGICNWVKSEPRLSLNEFNR